MPRPGQRRTAQRSAPDISPKTSPDTFAAASAALTARGWRQGVTFEMRPSPCRADEVTIAPIITEADKLPDTGRYEWRNGRIAAWHVAGHRLTAHMQEASWTKAGSSSTGFYFRRGTNTAPASGPDASELATAPPGAPVRLLAIAAEVGIGDGDLDEAVRAVAHEIAADEYNGGKAAGHETAHADAEHRASAVNGEGLAAQLACLYEGCASEAAFRSLLLDLQS